MMPPMKMNRLLLLATLLSLPLMAEEKSLSDGLRDALYLEEVKRDPAAAASAYVAILEGYAQQQQHAATALFRLAEIRRAEGRKDEAIALYQRLIAQFPNADAKTKLAKENLAALGAKLPEAGAAVVDKEELEFQRLKSLLDSSPDLMNHEVLESAVVNGYLRIVEWLMKDLRVQDVNKMTLSIAADHGNAKMTTLLIGLLGEAGKEQFPRALSKACSSGYLQIVRILLASGANPNQAYIVATMDRNKVSPYTGCPLVVALSNGCYDVADLLLASGADINSVEGEERVTPLSALIVSEHESKTSYLEKLIAKGADIQTPINITYFLMIGGYMPPSVKVTNHLSLPLIAGDVPLASTLLAKGIKKDRNDLFSCIGVMQPEQLQVATLLIEAGADPNSKVKGGLSLLAFAYKNKHLNLVKLLLSKGTNPNVDAWIKDERETDAVPNLTEFSACFGDWDYLDMFLNAGGSIRKEARIDIGFIRNKNTHQVTLSVMKKLVEKGFEPKHWKDLEFEGASLEVKAYLNERFPSEKPKADDKSKEDPSR